MQKVTALFSPENTNPQLGQSRPFRIIASDGKDYLLKNNMVHIGDNWLNEDAVFFQECLCYQLANLLGIPVPNFSIIELDEDFLSDNKQLVWGYNLRPGLYFGTQMLNNIENNIVDNMIHEQQLGRPRIIHSWNSFFKKVSNRSIFCDIIAFDTLTLNFDRFTNIGNLLVVNENHLRKIYAIDFGHSFYGPYYASDPQEHLNKLQRLNCNVFEHTTENMKLFGRKVVNTFAQVSPDPILGLGEIFRALADQIDFDNGNPFADIVYKIEHLTTSNIREIIDSIPTPWISGGGEQKTKYLDFLLRQKDCIRYILDDMNQRSAFINSVGGELSWNQDMRNSLIQ